MNRSLCDRELLPSFTRHYHRSSLSDGYEIAGRNVKELIWFAWFGHDSDGVLLLSRH